MNTFDGLENAADLALLSKQRTDAPLNVFDASQFKLAVNTEVSESVIKKLQKEFGDDLAGGE
jgi:hypothetical protein